MTRQTPQARTLNARLALLERTATGTQSPTEKAREVFRESFLLGHSCKVCPRIDIPQDLDEKERARRAKALRRLHYTRVSLSGRQRPETTR